MSMPLATPHVEERRSLQASRPDDGPGTRQEAGHSFAWDPRGRRIYPKGVTFILAASDLLGMLGIGFMVFLIHGVPREYDPYQAIAGAFLLTTTWTFSAQASGLYRGDAALRANGSYREAITAWAVAYGALLMLAFGVGIIGTFSRVWLLAWAAGALVWLLIARRIWSRQLLALLAEGDYAERVAVLAADAVDAARIARELERVGGGRTQVVWHGSDSESGCAGEQDFQDGLEKMLREAQVDRVYLAMRGMPPGRLQTISSALNALALNVAVVPDLSGLQVGPIRASVVGGMVMSDIATAPLTSTEALAKRTEDVVLSLLLLITLSPLLLIMAVLIKLDSPGPVLFRQRRVGFRGEVFSVLKFRSMRNEAQASEGPLRQTMRRDPRVTRIGHAIRATSIDELPQLVNVLRGEMSLVGPRPHDVTMTTENRPLQALVDVYNWRHRMKPGLTGWAQINGLRGEVQTQAQLVARVQHDLYYIDNWSIWLDLRIIVVTAVTVLFDKKAH